MGDGTTDDTDLAAAAASGRAPEARPLTPRERRLKLLRNWSIPLPLIVGVPVFAAGSIWAAGRDPALGDDIDRQISAYTWTATSALVTFPLVVLSLVLSARLRQLPNRTDALVLGAVMAVLTAPAFVIGAVLAVSVTRSWLLGLVA